MTAHIRSSLSLYRLLQISRPRFWLYVTGPFAIGCMLALRPLDYPLLQVTPLILAFLIYFTFPANILIYGINDIYDYETDRLNPKKTDYETLVTPPEHKPLFIWIAVATLPFLAFLNHISIAGAIAFFSFLFLAVFYSVPPIRAKIIPGVDTLFSAGIYVSSGVFGFYLSGGQQLSWDIVAAGTCWAMAMQAYSAVPDIEADRQSGIATIATWLGERNALLFCLLLYFVAAVLALQKLGAFAIIIGMIYCGMVLVSIRTQNATALFRLYTYFPAINITVGFLVFLVLSIGQRYFFESPGF